MWFIGYEQNSHSAMSACLAASTSPRDVSLIAAHVKALASHLPVRRGGDLRRERSRTTRLTEPACSASSFVPRRSVPHKLTPG
jgi:hypothetical protein